MAELHVQKEEHLRELFARTGAEDVPAPDEAIPSDRPAE